ncbi:MAG: LytTR family transcriptional regulator [Hyphomicrobiales bacterium]|nr:LytTR family transcriptional regulator [Hyphomicrobiales bacterium]MCP4997207.1 LytTR family transcriptional regulator [Hyphomicrobiales bacterium]
MKRTELLYVLLAALCIAGAISATNPNTFGERRIFLYLYWIVRIAIECGLFVAFRSLLEVAGICTARRYPLFLSAFLVSLFPFVLATTALDIVLGFPELGLATAGLGGASFLREFFLEVVYLADDHLFVCLLLSLPRFLVAGAGVTFAAHAELEPVETPLPLVGKILPMLDPPLKGTLMRVEAQEHYVIINSNEEQRMVLGRFSDVVATLPRPLGMQVHRSHWVAHAAVTEVFTENRNMKLRLANGDVVPVSRRFRDTVSEQFETSV